jgi:hypothetical protein
VNEEAMRRFVPQRYRKKKSIKTLSYIMQTALCSILMTKRLMLDGKVAFYCKVVRYTPNRIHGQNAEFVNITYSLVTMGFKGLNYFEDLCFEVDSTSSVI